jgi:hypothetical protein
LGSIANIPLKRDCLAMCIARTESGFPDISWLEMNTWLANDILVEDKRVTHWQSHTNLRFSASALPAGQFNAHFRDLLQKNKLSMTSTHALITYTTALKGCQHFSYTCAFFQ